MYCLYNISAGQDFFKKSKYVNAGGDGCTRMRTSCFYCLFFLRNYSQDWLSEVKQKNVDWF